MKIGVSAPALGAGVTVVSPGVFVEHAEVWAHGPGRFQWASVNSFRSGWASVEDEGLTWLRGCVHIESPQVHALLAAHAMRAS